MYFYARDEARNVDREMSTWSEKRRTVPAAGTRLGWESKRQRLGWWRTGSGSFGDYCGE
jgi:hypothetical protein